MPGDPQGVECLDLALPGDLLLSWAERVNQLAKAGPSRRATWDDFVACGKLKYEANAVHEAEKATKKWRDLKWQGSVDATLSEIQRLASLMTRTPDESSRREKLIDLFPTYAEPFLDLLLRLEKGKDAVLEDVEMGELTVLLSQALEKQDKAIRASGIAAIATEGSSRSQRKKDKFKAKKDKRKADAMDIDTGNGGKSSKAPRFSGVGDSPTTVPATIKDLSYSERAKLMKEGKCLYCRNKAGHLWTTCPDYLAYKAKGKVGDDAPPSLHVLNRHDQKLSDDVDDRMLVLAEFEAIQDDCNLKFTLDACCDDEGANRLVQKFYCPKSSFLHADVSNEHCWIHPPARCAHEFVMHYRRCKRRSPSTTSACILVPAHYAKSRKGSRSLRGMTMLREYPVGHQLVTGRAVRGTERVQLPAGIP